VIKILKSGRRGVRELVFDCFSSGYLALGLRVGDAKGCCFFFQAALLI
jgi:hypothetical protein